MNLKGDLFLSMQSLHHKVFFLRLQVLPGIKFGILNRSPALSFKILFELLLRFKYNNMDYKLVSLFLLIVVANVHGHHGKDPGHYRRKKIDEKCGTDQICVAAAEKCLGDKDAQPPTEAMTDTEKLAAFNVCLESHGKGADILNEEDCVKRPEVVGTTEAPRRTYQKCKKETLDYLRKLEDSGDAAAGDMRCCYFKATGVEMVSYSDNGINLDFFRQHLKDRISNQGVLDVYEGAFEACLPRGKMCNVHDFRECVMDECISRMQNS